MKRAFKVALILFLVVLVAIGLIVNYFGGQLIRQTVNVVGPTALGVPVSLDEAQFRLFRGNVNLKGLKVGNPKDFKTDDIFELGELAIDLDVRSLASGVIHIRKILVDAPKITYERGLTSSNLGALLAGLEKPAATNQPPEKDAPVEPAPAESEGGLKTIIDEIIIRDAQLNVSLTVAQGFSAPIPLPTLTLRDIGKETGGASIMEVIKHVLGAILGAVGDVIKGSAHLLGSGVGLVGDGAMAVGEAAADGAAAVGGAAVDGVVAVGKGASAVGGAAVDGAAAVGGAAMDGVKAVGKGVGAVGGAAVDGAAVVGGAAVDGVKAVGKGVGAVGGAVADGIGSLFGGGDSENADAQKTNHAEVATP